MQAGVPQGPQLGTTVLKDNPLGYSVFVETVPLTTSLGFTDLF